MTAVQILQHQTELSALVSSKTLLFCISQPENQTLSEKFDAQIQQIRLSKRLGCAQGFLADQRVADRIGYSRGFDDLKGFLNVADGNFGGI